MACAASVFAAGVFLAPQPVSAQAVAEAESDQDQAAKAEKVQQSGNALTRVTEEIKYLASDELAGRKPGTSEMKMAEDFIVKAYRDAGLSIPPGPEPISKRLKSVARSESLMAPPR